MDKMEKPLLLPIFYVLFVNVWLTEGGYPYDIICNNQTQFACICYQGDGGFRSYFPDCLALIGSKNLTVVLITAKSLDITDYRDGQLMETFFKKEMAEIISEPCEKLANNCKGTALAIHPDSIVLLRISCGADDITKVSFAVTKSKKVELLRPENTLSAELAVDSLNSNEAKLKELEKSLSPANIVDITNETIVVIPDNGYTGDPWKDNFSIIVTLLVLAGLLVFIYIIATAKVLRDVYIRKQKKKKSSKSNNNSTTPQTGYGATGNHFLPSQPVPRPNLRESLTENGSEIGKNPTSSAAKSDANEQIPNQEASESSPLLQKNFVPPKLSRVVPKKFSPPSPAPEMLFAPSILIKKASSSHAITRIEEETEETEVRTSTTTRSATFHEPLLLKDTTSTDGKEEISSDDEGAGSDEETRGYQELSGSIPSLHNNEETHGYSALQPEITIDSPQTPHYNSNTFGTPNFENLAPEEGNERRASQECLINLDQDADVSDQDSDIQDKPRKKKECRKKNPSRQFSSEFSSDEEVVESSDSSDTMASGLGAPEYERLAESNVSINHISDRETDEYLDLR